MEWLRIEDVLRLAQELHPTGASKKAFANRWPTRDEFLPDALEHALLRSHELGSSPTEYVAKAPGVIDSEASPSEMIMLAADGLLRGLLKFPRSYIVLHLGPLLPQHPELWEALLPSIQGAITM